MDERAGPLGSQVAGPGSGIGCRSGPARATIEAGLWRAERVLIDKWLSPMLGPGSWRHRAHCLRAVPCDDSRTGSYHDPNGRSGPEPERFTFVLHDLAQPPTAEQVSQGGLAPYVDGV